MKRSRKFLTGTLLLIVLSVGAIAASGGAAKGGLPFIHKQIGLLIDTVEELRLESEEQRAEIDSQQDQICELYDVAGLPFPPECITLPARFCEGPGAFFCEDGLTCCRPPGSTKEPPPLPLCCLE